MIKIIKYQPENDRAAIITAQEKLGFRMVSDTFYLDHQEMVWSDEPAPKHPVVRDLAAEIDALVARVDMIGKIE